MSKRSIRIRLSKIHPSYCSVTACRVWELLPNWNRVSNVLHIVNMVHTIMFMKLTIYIMVPWRSVRHTNNFICIVYELVRIGCRKYNIQKLGFNTFYRPPIVWTYPNFFMWNINDQHRSRVFQICSINSKTKWTIHTISLIFLLWSESMLWTSAPYSKFLYRSSKMINKFWKSILPFSIRSWLNISFGSDVCSREPTNVDFHCSSVVSKTETFNEENKPYSSYNI